jgi:uncharacterized lipoprotein YajG
MSALDHTRDTRTAEALAQVTDFELRLELLRRDESLEGLHVEKLTGLLEAKGYTVTKDKETAE